MSFGVLYIFWPAVKILAFLRSPIRKKITLPTTQIVLALIGAELCIFFAMLYGNSDSSIPYLAIFLYLILLTVSTTGFCCYAVSIFNPDVRGYTITAFWLITCITVLTIFSGQVLAGVETFQGSFDFYRIPGPFYFVFQIHILAFISIAISFLVRAQIRPKDDVAIIRSRYVLLSTLPFVLTGFIVILLRESGIPVSNNVGAPISTTFFVLVVIFVETNKSSHSFTSQKNTKSFLQSMLFAGVGTRRRSSSSLRDPVTSDIIIIPGTEYSEKSENTSRSRDSNSKEQDRILDAQEKSQLRIVIMGAIIAIVLDVILAPIVTEIWNQIVEVTF